MVKNALNIILKNLSPKMVLTKRKTQDELQQTLDYIVENLPRKCKRCGNKAKLIRDECLRLHCTWKVCNFKQSLFEGTVFAGTKLDKTKVLEILDCWMAKCPNNIIGWITGCSYDSVLRVLNIVKELAVSRHHDSLDVIGATDTIVEIDESKFGKRKYNRGHRVEGVWVLGMVERTPRRRLVLLVVDNRTKETLSSRISKHVNENSTIHTDCWKGYIDVKNISFEHKTVNHSKGFVNPLDGTHTNTIEGCWYAIKAQVPVRNRTNSRINLYLLRFMILRNEPGDALLNLLKYLIYLLNFRDFGHQLLPSHGSELVPKIHFFV
jgi:transposase-like protein